VKYESVLHCPLCGNPESRLFDQRSFYDQPVSNRICQTCGFVYQSPRIPAVDLERYYEKEYRLQYQGTEEPVLKDLAVQEARANALVNYYKGKTPAPSRHLDIGCSTGALLQKFQEMFGSHPAGVEPGDAYRAYAKRQGLAVFPSLEELQEAGQGPFDLVSMIHVLEHLPDPVAYLLNLRQAIMAEPSFLLLEVPNLYAHDCFEIAHLASFSAHTLIQVLKRAGFEILALRKHGQPRSLLLPLYITLIARPIPLSSLPRTFQLRRESSVSMKRKLGMLRRRAIQKLFPSQAWLPMPEAHAPGEVAH
jgi:2-polyprenyl-3-methyl-5-hydroxy-6-metoxy-1,4-benzoquinol methylase